MSVNRWSLSALVASLLCGPWIAAVRNAATMFPLPGEPYRTLKEGSNRHYLDIKLDSLASCFFRMVTLPAPMIRTAPLKCG
jgi:hypothetical protein